MTYYRYDEVIGYAYDAAINCPECIESEGFQNDDECTPILYGQNNDDILPGESCGICGSWYTPNEEWVTHEDESPREYRWAKCTGCGHQQCYHPKHSLTGRIDGQRIAAIRLAARRNELRCVSCHKRTMHF